MALGVRLERGPIDDGEFGDEIGKLGALRAYQQLANEK
jgi:hypothetical protein